VIAVEDLKNFYKQACEIELQAFKPGNVSVYADGHDMIVADFRLSAEVSAEALCNPAYSLGEKIFYAVQATREAVACNTNLGIVLLCAPLLQASANISEEHFLSQAVTEVLAATTIDDADWAFKAIALAKPGGLGTSKDQDVRSKASVTLTEAMRIAACKDRIALQYINNYKDIFDFLVPLYYNALSKWSKDNWAAVVVYAGLLGKLPDSHLQRKYGDRYSKLVSTRMALLSEALSDTDDPASIKPLLYRIDQEFKSKGINPGTSADLTVATILTVLLQQRLGHGNEFG
jgi:triphosphoribosyl-dephospho-CoA synthase